MPAIAQILLLMRKPGNVRVLSQALAAHRYACVGAGDREMLETLLQNGAAPDLALVDVSGFGESVWSMCEILQHRNVPFIVLSAKQELGMSSRTLSYGAISILQKPIAKASLLKLIEGMTCAGAS